MSRIWYIFSVCLMISAGAWSQVCHPRVVAVLPDMISESSGIEADARNSLWTHNDSGDTARIFNIDTLGNLIRTLYLAGVYAEDIEDVTQDDSGNYYLGDFGNNLNMRTNLRIYRIPNPAMISATAIEPGVIYFNYPDQQQFPPSMENMNYDCESMFHFRDSLYIFSKNRGISTWSRMYRLPDQPGTYTAQLIDSFNTVQWVTSADISPSGKEMVMMCGSYLWLFTRYEGTDFFGGSAIRLSMDTTQKEAVVFVSDTDVYLTDERFLGIGGNLYYLNLRQWIDGVADVQGQAMRFDAKPDPAKHSIHITCTLPDPSAGEFTVFDLTGARLAGMHKNLEAGTNELSIPVAGRFRGMLLVHVRLADGKSACRKVLLE